MLDERSLRQIIIDRIEAYVHQIKFYDSSVVESYKLDYDTMTDVDLVRELENIIFNSRKIKNHQNKIK